MIATVSFDFNGSIQVHEGTFRELDDIPTTDALATVSDRAILALDLFNEERPGFDYDLDGGRCAELLIWALEDAGFEPIGFDELERNMIEMASPGGPTGGPFQVELKTYTR